MPPPPGIPERPPVLKATGMWLPRPDWPRLAVVTGAAAALGGVVVAASDLTPMWQLVLLAAVATGAMMFWCRDLKSFVMYLMVADLVETPSDIRRVLLAAGAGLTLNLVMILLQFGTGAALNLQGAKIATVGTQLTYDATGGASAFRPAGFMLHPNKMADHLVLTLPILMTLSLLGPMRLGRRVWEGCTALLVCGVVALTITLSRGGWVSFGAAMAFLLLVGWRRGLIRPSRIVALGIAAVMLVVSVLMFYPQVVYR